MIFWVAFKELKINHHNPETLLFMVTYMKLLNSNTFLGGLLVQVSSHPFPPASTPNQDGLKDLRIPC